MLCQVYLPINRKIKLVIRVNTRNSITMRQPKKQSNILTTLVAAHHL